MILSITNNGYAFLIRLDLIFSVSIWKEFPIVTNWETKETKENLSLQE